MIRRSFSTVDVVVKRQLYVCMVRSKLSYCSQLWHPNLKKDILALECVQCRATKYILEDYTSSYKDRLVSLSLLPLMYWLELNDVMYLVSALKNPSDNVSIFQYVSFCKSSTRSSSRNLSHATSTLIGSFEFGISYHLLIFPILYLILNSNFSATYGITFFSTLIQLTPVLSTFTVLIIHALLLSFYLFIYFSFWAIPCVGGRPSTLLLNQVYHYCTFISSCECVVKY